MLDCTVTINGDRFNDGTGSLPGDPQGVILSGLKLTWGRATTVDQPKTATCTFTVADWTGTTAALASFPVGAPVDVDAAGLDYGAPTRSTFTDPTLTRLGPVTDSPGVTLTVHTDGAGLRSDPSTAGAGAPPAGHTTVFRPDDVSDTPSAWLTIPRLVTGAAWQARVAGVAPYAGYVYPSVVGFGTPRSAGFPLARYPQLETTGPFDYTLDWVPNQHHEGLWAGVTVDTYRFATWADLAARTGLSTWAEQPQTWEAMGVTDVTHVDVIAPDAGGALQVRVFSGRVTDVTAGWDEALGALVTEVTAADLTADLANRRVGAEPWPTETASARVDRILFTAGQTGLTATLDPALAGYLVGRDDVDAQSPVELLEDVAWSVDAVMWAATSDPTGPYLRFEDVAARVTGRQLVETPPGRVVIVVDPGDVDALVLDGCAVLRDSPTWRQDVTDVITRVGVKWALLGTDTDGKPTSTEHTEWLTDPGSEVLSGVRTLAVGTSLTTALDAATIAGHIAGRTFGPAWRIEGMTVLETALADTATPGATSPAVTLARLLDGTERIGLLLDVTGLPTWAPNQLDGAALVYLEGGVYTFDPAGWVLELVTSDPRGQGGSVTWEQLDPAWLWDWFDPSVTWAHLQGAAA